ncbi:hypothetical protein LXL04_004667 [Taraxacum kok-saghyz]
MIDMVSEDDVTSVVNIRMKINAFTRLCDMLEQRGGLKNTKNICYVLHTLAHNEKNRIIVNRFRRSGETIICRLHKEFYKTPVPIPDDETDERWRWFMGCLGALDGTYIKVKVPEAKRKPYRTRKGEICTNVLGVCTRDLQFTYVLAGWEGSAANSQVLRDAINRQHGLKIPHVNHRRKASGYNLVLGLEDDMEFSSKSLRCAFEDRYVDALEIPNWWSKLVPCKVNVFVWRACLGRLPNRFNLGKRGVAMHSSLCPWCNRVVESKSHLLNRWRDSGFPRMVSDVPMLFNKVHSIGSAKVEISHRAHIWVLWNYRNEAIFKGKTMCNKQLVVEVKSIRGKKHGRCTGTVGLVPLCNGTLTVHTWYKAWGPNNESLINKVRVYRNLQNIRTEK